jgi:hypothetical protein
MNNTKIRSAHAAGVLKPAVRALALAGALTLPLAVSAQVVPIDFEAEGVVTSIALLADGSVNLTVFGREMNVPKGANIHTPTATITHAQLADPTRFPGRTADGFIGGTAILIGEVGIGADGTATPIISDVAIEPAETVLAGTITRNDAGDMALLGVPMTESTDARLPSGGYHNDFGFPINPMTIPVGTFAAIEGYYADDGSFHHFLVEASGGELTDPATPQSSILRARCVPGGRLEVLGASYLPAAATIEFRNPRTNFLFGSMSTTVDLEQPQFGTYVYRVDVNEGEVDSEGACPSQVLAINLTNNTEATATVDGVTAPATVAPPAENVAPVAVDDAENLFVGLATEVHLTLNDTDANGNMDNTTVQVANIPPGLAVQNTLDGNVLVTASAAGTHSFTYTVGDTDGAVSNPATVTVTADPVAMDVVDITRANYRSDKNRWEIRGTTNQAGVSVSVVLLRTNETIATVTADATGAWQIDARNTGITALVGDVLRAISSGGSSDDEVVNLTQ